VADTTGTFAVPLDTHRVVVVQDTKRNRDQFQREETETVYLDGLKTEELTEISNIAKNVFGMKQVGTVEGRSALTLRAQPAVLDAFNRTMNGLVEGRSQVMLDVEILQVARTHERNTGATLPQQMTAFNVYSEEQSILSQNSDLVQEIISSGLASADDPLAILGILIASGAVSSTLFANGLATFGSGLTLTALAPGSTSLNLVLNSSSTRALDNVRLRAADGQEETLRNGMRYPILTASYSGLTSSSISGLTSAGTSSTLSSLLSSSSSSTSTIPQIQYQDLGLTLKATPKVLRNGDVALSMDLKLTSLAGSTENDIPVLNSRSYSGVITVKAGSGALLVSLVDESESRALSGTPGLSEIPGLNNLTDKDVTKDYATLVIAVTPHVLRGPDTWGHTPMLRIDRTAMAR
jgi:type II secretory pathway component GspD/PulD (secretin)